MPVLPNADSVLRLEAIGTVEGEPFVNVFHFHYAGGTPSDADLLAWLGSTTTTPSMVHSFFVLAQWFPASVIWTEFKVVDLSTSTGSAADVAVTIAGNQAGHGIGPQVCVLSSYKIARRYRGGHPRTYWPTFPLGKAASTRSWDPTWCNDLGGDIGNMFAAATLAKWTSSTGIQAVSLSYHSGHVLRTTPVVDAITGISVSPIWATQRRRLHR